MGNDNEILLWLTAYLESPEQTLNDVRFQAFIREGANREEFYKTLELYRQARKITLCNRIDSDEAWRKTIHIARHGKQRAFLRRIATVASVAAVIVLGVFVLWPKEKGGENVLSADAGEQKAIIRMADGSEYLLAGALSGIVSASNGVDILLDSNNNVRYVVKDSVLANRRTNTLVIPRGGYYSITLSDGSRVKLNSESQLRYPVVFTKNERVVYLTGEAYFEVATNPTRPFHVICNNHRVTVTGTKFNVSAYEKNMCATLVEGVVTVSNEMRQQRLQPGEQAIVSDQDIRVCEVETSVYTAWAEGRFEFDNTSLGDIVKTLSRWYDIDFEFADPRLKGLTFTFSAPCDENLSFIVGLLERVSAARFKAKADKIEIYPKQ